MLDWKWIVANENDFLDSCQRRNMKKEDALSLLASVQSVAKKRVALLTQVENLRAEKNKISGQVPLLIKGGKKEDAQALIESGKQMSMQLTDLDQALSTIEKEFDNELIAIPNVLGANVPVGKSDADNQVVREWGQKKEFSFEPLPHDEWGEKTGLIDFERAAKVSGARFVFLKGDLARLDRALASLMLDLHRERGYQEFSVPHLVSEETLFGVGQLPKFREDLYKVEGEDKFLIPTTEVPLGAYYRGEILNEALLPLKVCGLSTNFRSEAGSYGKDTRGMIRQHQFQKVELFKFTRPEESESELQSMLVDAQNVLEALELPYRVSLLCSGDTGFNANKTYDIEVWLPGSVFEGNKKGCYREISSCSNCGDFQARRSMIRFKSMDTKKIQLVHTLNGSGLAIGRCLVAVIENYQNADGSLTIPKALRSYMAGQEKIVPTLV